MLFGNSIAKVFGLFRELLFLIYIGDSIHYSEILSLFVVSGVVIYLSDSSFLNPILYPNWKRLGKETINIKINHVLYVLGTSLFFYYFNETTLNLSQPFAVKVICSTLWIPLLFHGFGYSFLLYSHKLSYYNLLIGIISFSYLACFWILKDFGANGYLISRFTSIIIGLVFVLYVLKGRISFSFILEKINLTHLKDSIKRFANVNNFILGIFCIRFILSQFDYTKLAILNYALVILFVFYTLVNKNLNALTILEDERGRSKARAIQLKYVSLFLCALVFLFVVISYLPNLSYGMINKKIILQILFITLCLSPTLIICGGIDLKNSEKIISESAKYNWQNLIYLAVSIILFFSINAYFNV